MNCYGYAQNYQAFTLQRLQAEAHHLGSSWQNLKPTAPLPPDLPAGVLWFRSFGLDYTDQDLFFIQQSGPQLQVINPLASIARLRDKYLQYQYFANLGMPVIPTVLIHDFCQLHSSLPWAESGPLVLKTRRGLQGKGVSFHPNQNLLLAFWRAQHQGHPWGAHFLVQPWIPNPKVEMRLFFWGHEQILLEKIPGADFRQNARFAQFHVGDWHCLGPSEQQLLTNIMAHSQCFYGAVDFFVTNSGIRLIEVNSMPGIEALESATKRNIANELLRASNQP